MLVLLQRNGIVIVQRSVEKDRCRSNMGLPAIWAPISIVAKCPGMAGTVPGVSRFTRINTDVLMIFINLEIKVECQRKIPVDTILSPVLLLVLMFSPHPLPYCTYMHA